MKLSNHSGRSKPHRPGAGACPGQRPGGATPPRERRGEMKETPLLPEEGWRAQRDGVVGACLPRSDLFMNNPAETSQYLEEEKSIEMPGVAASERGTA